MIEFQCTSCSQRIRAKDEHALKACKCPRCQAENTIPDIQYIPEETSQFTELSADDTQQSHLPVRYAGFWKRLAALLIDSFILAIPGGVLGAVTGAIAGMVLGAQGASQQTILSVCQVLGFITGVTMRLLYFSLMESSSRQATLGKMVLGIIVINKSGERLSFGHAVVRHFAKFVSVITLCIGYIMAAFTGRKQALHDLIVSTYVIDKNRK